jgi:hypothetical protein
MWVQGFAWFSEEFGVVFFIKQESAGLTPSLIEKGGRTGYTL